nr:conserved Plasmodium protein, unknown function [Ipomoea trifida]
MGGGDGGLVAAGTDAEEADDDAEEGDCDSEEVDCDTEGIELDAEVADFDAGEESSDSAASDAAYEPESGDADWCGLHRGCGEGLFLSESDML